jgi:pentapeptide MXKDX repeat protein
MIRNSVRILTVLCALCLFTGLAFAQGGMEKSDKKMSSGEMKDSKKSMASSKVDINSATKEELTAVSGIDDATAQKIIDGRPYKTKHDLVKKNILSKDEYAKVKNDLVAHGGKMGKDNMKKDDMKKDDMKKDDMKKDDMKKDDMKKDDMKK